MKKNLRRTLALLLAALRATTSFTAAGFAAGGAYRIVSPYEDVIWEGDNAWGAYKGNLHTHSTVSDAEMDYNEMILEHYRQGFDFLAMTDHGVTGKAWNEEPTHLPLYLYQYIAGRKTTRLTQEEYEGCRSTWATITSATRTTTRAPYGLPTKRARCPSSTIPATGCIPTGT